MISERKRIVACLTVCAVVAYAGVLFFGATFVGRDHLTQTLPAKQFIADTLRDGHIPEWWPAVDLGVPFIANPDHSALYPPVWLVALLPMPFAADFILVLHVLLAGFGAAALSRRLGADTQGAIVAGTAFMLGGFVTSSIVAGGPLLTMAWVPWLAWATDRLATTSAWHPRLRAAMVLAALAGMQLLAGHPSMVITGGLLAFGVGLCRGNERLRTVGAIAGAYVVAIALAAVALVPALLLAGESSRTGGLAGEAATTWSMHPLRILEWIWPGVFGDPNQASEHLARVIANTSEGRMAPAWAVSVYVSLPVLALFVLACVRDRALRWLAIIVVLFVVLALGRFTPFYDLYRTLFLPERLVRYPEKYLGGAIVIVCALAGVGWTMLAQRLPSRRSVIAILSAVALFAVLVLALPAFSAPHELIDVDAALAYARRQGVTALLVSVGIAGIFALAKRPRLRWLAFVVLSAHFVVLVWETLPAFDRDVLAQPPQIVRGIDTSRSPRIARPFEHAVRPRDRLTAQARTLYEGAAPNSATRFGFAYLVGYDQAHSALFRAWRPTLATAADRTNDLFAVDYVIVWAHEVQGPVLATDAPFGPYALVRNEDQRPRAFVAPRWRYTTDDSALRDVLANLDLGTVHLTGTGAPSEPSMTALSPCTIASARPEAVDITCAAESAGYAVLLDAYAAGWSATVDGKPARIERAEGVARAVRIEAGRHTIAFSYATPGLRAGAIVSLLAWLALIGAAVAARFTLMAQR